jgi:hypothetical protein
LIYLISYKVPFDFFRTMEPLEKVIKEYPGWCKCFESSWLIATYDTIETVSTELTKYFEEKDTWLIAAISEQICGGLSNDAWEWLKDTRSKGF